jgi:hypothetical protein
MDIRYFDPLSRAWERMKKALFRPFDLKIWFVVGFTAFLSGLTDCHGGGNGKSGWQEPSDIHTLMNFPDAAREWLAENPVWAILIAFGIVTVTVLVIVLTWLSSRGKFMFLDNVVHNRALVAQPWREYRAEGNSLFLWRIVFGFATLAVVLVYLAACFSTLYARYEQYEDTAELVGPLILMVVGLAGLVIVITAISLFLTDFVVPVMYRQRISAARAWGVFLRLFSLHPMQFVGYTLLILLLIIVLVLAIVIGGLLTCCIGFLILAIPYINEVLLLPVTYTLRAFSVEFLEQFGPEFQLFPRPAAAPAAGGPQQP